MAKLIINKHFAEHNEAANGFSNVDGNEDYVFGEIIICNDKENPSIYIKDIDNNSIGIGNVRIVDNDKILSKTDGGKLQTSIKMAWDGVNNQIKLFGTDEETPISTIDANNIIETIDRTIEVTAVKFGYEDVPNGLTANQDYIKITSFIDNKENIQYLPYVKEENEISISGDGIVVVSKDMDGVKISHSTVDVVYPEETELGFGKGQYISGVNVNEFGHVTEIKTATLPIPNTTLEKVIDKENGIDAQEGYYVYDVKPDGDGLKYKVEYAQLPSTVIYDEDITPEQKEKTGTFISEIKVEGDVVSYKKSDVNLDNYYTKAEAEKAFIDSSELDQKLKNMGLTEDGKLPEIAITINKDEVGDGKYISDIEVSTIDKTHLTLKTTSLGLDKFIDKESVVSNNAELSWGETTTIAAIGNKELKVSLPSKPGVVIGVSEENTTDSTYVLVGVNESAEETNEIVFEKMDFQIKSVLTTKHVETKDNTLSWGTAVSVATVGDKDIKVKLPDTVISINPTEEKKGVSVITNISVDENDPTQLNVNYEDLIPKDVVKTEDLIGYATEEFVTNQGYLVSDDLNGYATEEFVTGQGYLKSSDLNGYATQNWVTNTALADNATQTWVESKGYLTEVPSEYVKEGELNNKFAEKEHNHISSEITDSIDIKSKITSTATELVQGKAVYDFVTGQDYLKSDDLNGYAKESWVSDQIANAVTGGVIDLSGYAKTEYVNQTFVKNGDLDNYASKTWVEEQDYLTEVPSEYITETELNTYNFLKAGDLNSYATQTWVEGKGYTTQTWVEEQNYLTKVPSGYVKSEDLNGYLKSGDLNGYATQTWVEEQDYLTEVPSGYVKAEDLNGYLKSSDLNGYATQGWVETQGYLTEVPSGYVKSEDLNGYAKESWVSEQIANAVIGGVIDLSGYATTEYVNKTFIKNGDLVNYATQNWVTNTALADNATQTWVKNQGYLTQTSLNGYVKSSDIEGKFADKTHNHASSEITDSISDKSKVTATASELVQGKAVYNFVTGQGYLKSSDLNGYATQNWVTGTALTNYATKDFVTGQGYLTQTSLNGYVKSSDIEGKFADKTHNHASSEITDSINNKTGITTTASELVQGKAVYDFVDDKLSGYIKKGEETKYTLLKAEENALGGIKTGYSSNDKNYAVEVDANGNAYVNVPWVEVKDYLPNDKAVPSNLHYDPTATTNTYTADSGKYISGIKYDDKHHVTGINQSTLPETNYESSTFITIKDKVVSANTGDTSSTLARGDHNHSGVYQPVGEYVETNDLKTLTFNAGAFTATTFKANADSTVKIPTSTSHLTNDSNWITSSDISITVQGTNGLTGGGTIGNGGTATISHAENNLTTGSSSTTLKHGDTFDIDYPTIDSYGHVTKLSTTTYTLPNVTAESLGLGAALKYCGITTTVLTDGATTNPIVINSANHTAEAGCVVFYDDKEFVFNGSNWELLGAEVTYKVVQSAVSSPSASGNAAAFIDTISQDANGKITATKKNVRSATTGQTGVVSLVIGDMKDKAHADGQAPSLNHTHSQYTNQNAFSNVVVSSTTISANSPTDTLTLVAGENVTITPDATNDKITIAATKYTLPTATTAVTGGVKLVAGDMNGEEHVDGQAPSLNHTHSQYLPLSGGTLTGNLRLKDSGSYGMKLNFGDGEYVYLHEMPDDSLEISAANAVTLYTEYGSLYIGEEGKGASFSCNVHASAFYQDSDERLKTFGDDIEIDFDKLKSIPKKYFTWNDDRKEGVDLGTSAQAVKELYPEIVSGDETLSVDYAKLSIIALKAVDKLHEENEMLRTELAMIKKHLGL